MTTKVVVRLLDADQSLLGWAEVAAVARGDGQLWCTQQVVVVIEQGGMPSWLSVHWADINVETRGAVNLGPKPLGAVVPVFEAGTPVLRVGPMPGPLPAVTMRAPVGIAVPVAHMGARG